MNGQIEDIDVSDLRKMLRSRPAGGHKGTFGHALLVAGSQGMAGAAILSAEACLRSGIGKLSIQTVEANRVILQISVPEAILKMDADFGHAYDAVGVGPGLGRDFALLHACLHEVEAPAVYDADALNMLAERREWQTDIPANSILTPHPLEAERLTGSRELGCVSAYAQKQGVIVVLKGHPTHVCLPTDSVFRLAVGNNGMGTAGSGDVLTGIITGLLAQGHAPHEAALLGVWLHGTAGDYAAHELTEHCMLARDIIRHLPDAFRALNTED